MNGVATAMNGEAMAMNYPETEEKFCKDLTGKHQLEDVLSIKVWFSTHPVFTTPQKGGGGGRERQRELFSSMPL
jgi:hypothetical protein